MGAIFFLALFLRALNLVVLPDDAGVLTTPDSSVYLELRDNLLEVERFVRKDGDGGYAPEIERTPGYPLFLAGLQVIAGPSLRVIVWAQAVLDSISVVLIGLTMAAMITLSANAALAANAGVIRVLRLVGARDTYIARAFVRRFTGRAFQGAAIGTALGMAGIALLPGADPAGGFLTGLGFHGFGWLWPLVIPPLAALVAFWATRMAAFRVLGGVT